MSDKRYTEDLPSMVNIAMLTSLGFFYMGFFMPIIARTNMNASALLVGITISSLVIGHLISTTVAGYITDKINLKKHLIFIGSIGRGSSYFIIYFAIIINSIVVLIIGMFILGFMAGFFWIPFDTLIAEKSSKDHRSYAFGKRETANAKGQLIGALIGFTILMGFSPFTSNPIILYSGIIIFGLSNYMAGYKFLKVDESIKFVNDDGVFSDDKPKAKFHGKMILGIIFLCFCILFSSINHNLGWPFLNIYIMENISSSFYILIIIYVPVAIIAMFAAPKLGIIVDKINPILGFTFSIVAGAIVTWFLINTTIIWLFATLLLIDMTIGLAAGLMFRNLLSRISIEHRGKVMSLSAFFSTLGAAIGPIIGGMLWDNLGPKAPFILSIWVELCLIPLYWLVIFLLLPYLAEKFDKNSEMEEI